MNLWQCDAPRCDNTAVGEGGAIGLRAIGWYFSVGPSILCPAHHPDKLPCTDLPTWPTPEEQARAGKACSLCAAKAQADRIQETLLTTDDRATAEALRRQPPRFDDHVHAPRVRFSSTGFRKGGGP